MRSVSILEYIGHSVLNKWVFYPGLRCIYCSTELILPEQTKADKTEILSVKFSCPNCGIKIPAFKLAEHTQWTRLPRSTSTEPIRAYKWSRIQTNSSMTEATFCGVNSSTQYGLDDKAICRYHESALNVPRHLDALTPVSSCECGFYAFKHPFMRMDWVAHSPSAQLEVDLGGRVFEYSLGYRAERQRIIRVLFPVACSACGHRREDEPSIVSYVGQLRTICSYCLINYSAYRPIALAKLQNLLQVEVTYQQNEHV